MPKNPDGIARDMAAQNEARNAGIRKWVADTLGGQVTDITRLPRWRPLWKVTAEVGSARKTLLFRGDRPINAIFSLQHEMRVLEALHKNGIKVPHIYGWCAFPAAIVIEFIDTGRDRDPGMIQTAIEVPTEMPPDRWQAMLDYMGELAAMHAIPPREFRSMDGYAEPKNARELALNTIERQYAFANAHGYNDPMLTFIMSWLRRHVPEHRREASFVTGDAGQFMARGSEIIANVDFEIAHIGDYHWDLACYRGRHPYENCGDIPALHRQYAKVSGRPVETPVIRYHTVSFLCFSAIAARAFMDADARDANWIEGVYEYASCVRRALEGIAEASGFTLETSLHLPEPAHDTFADSGFEKLLIDVARLPLGDAFAGWERDTLLAIPQYLHRERQYGAWMCRENIADISAFAGRRAESSASADVAVLEAISANERDGARDEALTRLLHRRILRLSMLAAGSDPTDGNPLFFRLQPLPDA